MNQKTLHNKTQQMYFLQAQMLYLQIRTVGRKSYIIYPQK